MNSHLGPTTVIIVFTIIHVAVIIRLLSIRPLLMETPVGRGVKGPITLFHV